MKLIMQGIHLIYGDHDEHSFLGRQPRGLALFSVSIMAWLVAVALSVFGSPLRRWMIRGFGTSPLFRGFWNVMLPVLAMALAMLVLTLIYRVARRHWTSTCGKTQMKTKRMSMKRTAKKKMTRMGLRELHMLTLRQRVLCTAAHEERFKTAVPLLPWRRY
jgi:ABC-type multidrug transport system fused ATPase/permease subunit